MGPTRVNRKLSFESGEEQIKGYGKVTQNTEIFSTKYGNNILEVGSPAFPALVQVMVLRRLGGKPSTEPVMAWGPFH